MTDAVSTRADTRDRIVAAAARLLQQEGPSAVTTRGVAERAGVQAPTIYRLFGDKDGLLEAVAEQMMAAFASAKAVAVEAASAASVDPVDDLRAGWDAQIEFGLANPHVFRLLSEPGRVARSPAARVGRRVLEARLHRVAAAGRLRVGERRAVGLLQAAGVGTIQILLTTSPEERDPGLAAAMLTAVLSRILVDAPPSPDDGSLATAVAFRALAPRLETLSDGERRLLTEWLDRVIDAR